MFRYNNPWTEPESRGSDGGSGYRHITALQQNCPRIARLVGVFRKDKIPILLAYILVYITRYIEWVRLPRHILIWFDLEKSLDFVFTVCDKANSSCPRFFKVLKGKIYFLIMLIKIHFHLFLHVYSLLFGPKKVKCISFRFLQGFRWIDRAPRSVRWSSTTHSWYGWWEWHIAPLQKSARRNKGFCGQHWVIFIVRLVHSTF